MILDSNELFHTIINKLSHRCPSSMTDIKMSGPSSNTTNKMFGPGNPSMGQGKEQLHPQVNRRNLMRPS